MPRLKATWTRSAAASLEDWVGYVGADNPAAAARQALRALDAVDRKLLSFPGLGKPGRVPGTHQWPIPKTPLTLVYRVQGEVLMVLSLLHQARGR